MRLVKGLALAFLTVVLATAVKLAAGTWLAEDADALFLAAVAVVAWRSGIASGIAGVALAAASQLYFFLLPRYVFRASNGSEVFGLATWMVEGALVCTLVGALTKARAELARRNTTTERALEDSEEAYRRLFDSSPVPMYVFDPITLDFAAVNDAALHLYGYERAEMLGTSMMRLKVPEDTQAFQKKLDLDVANDVPVNLTTRHVKKDGRVMNVEVSARTVVFRDARLRLAVVSDRTEHEQLEAELRQAHKMDALGRLAGNVAHDFNNMLMVILGFAWGLIEETPPESETYASLVEIRRAAERSAELTKHLLAFSRQQPTAPHVADVNEVVESTSRLVQRVLGESISLTVDLAATQCRAEVDAGQLEQAIVNLAVNARDAMPSGGQLGIKTAMVQREGRPHVLLSVSDAGTGMDAATLNRIFEPFFTTKPMGKGTGLGLAIVFGLVKRVGGHVDVESKLGVGTTFHLCFPSTDTQPVAAQAPPSRAALAGTETVLVVDDDEQVLAVTERALRRAGYRTLGARHPGEAIVHCEQHPGAIDLLLTDVRMPQMNGKQLAERLVAMRPSMKILYTSGYTDNVVLSGDAREVAFVQKPTTPETLLRKVRDVLER
ncbi:MAG TPA: ATP-binding protein, partial [Polyangiaceae bacterium]|nr:ATP-binding protein [Polyangiaceae bacterium]